MLARSVLGAAAAALFAGCAAGPDLGSRQWQELASPTMASLRGLCALPGGIAVAAGAGGIVLRTLDGGGSWEPVGPRAAEALDFRSLAALDSQQLLVANAGSPARVYASSDGGRHWTLAHEDPRPAAFFDSVVLDGSGRGYLLGDPVDRRFLLLRTSDGGRSWVDAGAALPAAADGEAAFAASNGCLVLPAPRTVCFVTGGAVARALLSLDDGRSWHSSALPLRQGRPSQGAFAVAFADALHGVVVGGDHADAGSGEGTAACTIDGGVTWQAALRPPDGYRSAVTAVPGQGLVFVAVGPTGASISRDGGQTWQRFLELGFHTVRATPDGELWAAGSGGRIARLLPR